ncbi:La-related protein 6A [Morella rubra]|uniref:La-related protein 6A n=1 Tax=Morella rubra TaxID=262757 RepID=A0A6A1W7U3_9ROSI|nr:La-related protein 6A [Morella rubra]
MEGVEGPPSATAPHSGPPSPPQDLDHDFTPVGSPGHDHEYDDHALHEIHALPSDEDHEHVQELDQETLSELKELAYVEGKLFPPLVASNAATNLLLGRKSLRHVEYYYSDENLQTDKYMLSFIKKNKEGFVPVAVIASFRKMKKLTRDYSLIAAALRESSFLVVSANGRKIKRLHPLLSAEVRDPKLFTVLAENLPEDHSVENIWRIFGEAGNIKNICIRDPHAVEESAKGSKPDMLISSKVEYYYSDENLQTDKYMLSFIKKNKEGFVPVAVIASFRKMKKLTRDYSLIAAALRESSFLVVSANGRKIKRLHPLLSAEVRDPKLFTVLAENLPEDHSVENIWRIFGEAGNIKNICIRDPHAVEESAKGSKPDMLISSKLHALVEYETAEAAEKAVATLNDERDWRSGMRVKLLKRVVKYGQRRQVWRAPDSEKNSNSRGSDHTGDEENHNWSEHHDDTQDEEDGEHLSKDKNGHRGRNRGRARKHNYRGINGLGHGSASSTHAVEASKPPPGPRMPDGTRGFTMGRGRPPSANQS